MAELDHSITEQEMDGIPEDPQPEQKQDLKDVPAIVSDEKRWPGWPGETVFRMLVPAQKVGSIIGRKGDIIKKMCEETRARIKFLDGPHGIAERAVMISAKEEPDSPLPPAIDGLLRVHKRMVDGLDGDSSHAPGGKVSTKLLLPAAQAGSLIGKQGTTVKSIQEASNCIVRILGPEALPIFALEDDKVVEVVGEPTGVHKGLELIGSHLRKFLVDRSIIPLFEMQMQVPNQHMQQQQQQMEHMPPPQSWGPPPQSFPQNPSGGHGYGANSHFMPPPRQQQYDNYYPQAEMPPPMEKQPHQGISAYGREAPMGVHAPPNTQSMPSVITQVTQQMQIPLSYADAVIGTSGSNISYIRRASGSTVAIQETRGVPGEMTVEINGTAAQVQTAQQLIQNYMAEAAAAAAPSQPQAASGGASNEQAYNSYQPHTSVYTSPPSNTGYNLGQPTNYGSTQTASYGGAGQTQAYGATDQTASYGATGQAGGYTAAGQTGGYGGAYGTNYGY